LICHGSHFLHRSGQLNDKTRQLMELQARTQAKFAEMQASFAEGIKTARDVQKDLDWTQKKVEYDSCHFPVSAMKSDLSPVSSISGPLKSTPSSIRWPRIAIPLLWTFSFPAMIFLPILAFSEIFLSKLHLKRPSEKHAEFSFERFFGCAFWPLGDDVRLKLSLRAAPVRH
jgi:hypothetical protein